MNAIRHGGLGRMEHRPRGLCLAPQPRIEAGELRRVLARLRRRHRVFTRELGEPLVAVNLDRVHADLAQHDGAVIGGLDQQRRVKSSR